HALILLARVPSMPPALEGRRSDFSGGAPGTPRSGGGTTDAGAGTRANHASFVTLPPQGPPPRAGVRAVSNLSGRNAISEPRFTTLTPETMTADQKRVADAIQSGPRGAGLRGPFNALLRSPELCDLVQRLGAFVRFGTSIPQRLNEMAIIMAGRKWTA